MKLRFKILGINVLILFMTLSCTRDYDMKNNEPNLENLREKMVDQQIIARGVKDSLVIAAMKKVPRHLFASGRSAREAYLDEALPIGKGQTISQPYIVAFMTEQLKVKPGDKVLEIGTGSGYQAAVLAQIVESVFTIEIIKDLADNARDILQELEYKNVTVRLGDGYHGWEEEAPFDAIIVTAAPPKIPPLLLNQLKVGGIMVLPVGDYVQELVVINKTERGMEMKNVLPVRFVPMTGEIRK